MLNDQRVSRQCRQYTEPIAGAAAAISRKIRADNGERHGELIVIIPENFYRRRGPKSLTDTDRSSPGVWQAPLSP